MADTLAGLSVPFDVEIHATYLREPPPMRIRTVDVPANKIPPNRESTPELIEAICDLVFHYGQNDFQPRPFPSVSVGDVIRIGEARYRVEPVGFERIA